MTTDKTGTLRNARMYVLEARTAMDRATALLDMIYYSSEKNEPGRMSELKASETSAQIALDLQHLVGRINEIIKEVSA